MGSADSSIEIVLPEATRMWLLESPEPYIRYQAQRLITPDASDSLLLDGDPFIQESLAIISQWRDEVLTRHDKPGLAMHRLAMLADLGVTARTTGCTTIIDDLLSNIEDDGIFSINIMIPKVFGGTNEVTKEWTICDFPVVVYGLLSLGVVDMRLDRSVSRLMDLAGESFYPCCSSIPKFKGPGRRGGMCPYANLLVARALSASAVGRASDAAQKAAGAVLDHWANRKTEKPFLFGMGTDFKKLKFPMVWYNLLHVLSGIFEINGMADDARYLDMEGVLRSKLDEVGRVKPESIYMIYKSHEWSDKKAPSRLLTILVHRVLMTAERRRSEGRQTT